MTWDKISAIDEFRKLMADRPDSKRASQKNVIGLVNGVNTAFRTYDKHIVKTSLLVFAAGVDITDSVTLDDPISGEMTISPAPALGSSSANISLKASYYWQWWRDDDIIEYLNKGAEKVGVTTPYNAPTGSAIANDISYQAVPQGLRTAVLYYAGAHAQNMLNQFMMNRKHSGEYLAEQDGNTDQGFAQIVSQMIKQLDYYSKQAQVYRDQYYERDGRRNAPAFGIKVATTRRYGPSR